MAFKVIDQFGRPVKVNGVIKNQKGELIDSFKTLHDGITLLCFPRRAKVTATWKDEKGKEYKTTLPATKETGISLQLTISGNKRNFFIQTNEATASKVETVHLVGTINQSEI